MNPITKVQIKQKSINRWNEVLEQTISKEFRKIVPKKIEKLKEEIKIIKTKNPELFF